jgi:hypothetical protein
MARLPADFHSPRTTLSNLVDYYQTKRLDQQMAYFSQAAQRSAWQRFASHLPAACFFISVLLVFGHFAFDVYKRKPTQANHANASSRCTQAGELLVVLAACLPVLGAGIRTVHLASERRRNTTRFQAKHYALRQLRQELQEETEATAIFRLLWQCERIMEVEHREWLRLMMEAEWFG